MTIGNWIALVAEAGITQWEVFLAIVAIVAFVAALAGPMIKLNTTITKLNTTMEHMRDRMREKEEELEVEIENLRKRNSESHARIWEHSDQQDEKLNDHERRITVMEDRRNEGKRK